METEVSMVFDINRTVIAVGGTGFGMRAGIDTSALKRATELAGILAFMKYFR